MSWQQKYTEYSEEAFGGNGRSYKAIPEQSSA